jgi:hypothetical protein
MTSNSLKCTRVTITYRLLDMLEFWLGYHETSRCRYISPFYKSWTSQCLLSYLVFFQLTLDSFASCPALNEFPALNREVPASMQPTTPRGPGHLTVLLFQVLNTSKPVVQSAENPIRSCTSFVPKAAGSILTLFPSTSCHPFKPIEFDANQFPPKPEANPAPQIGIRAPPSPPWMSLITSAQF